MEESKQKFVTTSSRVQDEDKSYKWKEKSTNDGGFCLFVIHLWVLCLYLSNADIGGNLKRNNLFRRRDNSLGLLEWKLISWI